MKIPRLPRRLSLGLLIIIAVTLGLALVGPRSSQGQGGPNKVSTVSAASFGVTVAPDSIAAAFGTRLATTTVMATALPLPTSLGGTTVRVNGQLASLFFVSPGQVNFMVPSSTPVGNQAVMVTAGDGTVSTGIVQVSAVAPAIFTANASGSGVPAGVLLRVRADGAQIYEPIARFDAAQSRFVPTAINLGPAGELDFLLLYVTGTQRAIDPNGDGNFNETVHVLIGGEEITPAYVGASGFAGVEQINVPLPGSLKGRGSVNLSVNYTTQAVSNIAGVEIGGAPPPVMVSGIGPDAALVGQEFVVNGTGFAAVAGDNKVTVVDDKQQPFSAPVNGATTSQIRATVPFGAGSGTVRVETPQGTVQSLARLNLRTSISGFVATTRDEPLPGITVSVTATNGSAVTVVTNAQGLFVLPDVIKGQNRVLLDTSKLPKELNYPSPTFYENVIEGHDNHLERIALQGATGPSLQFPSTPTLLPTLIPTVFAAPQTRSIQTDGVVFEVADTTTAVFPNDADTDKVTLTRIENSRPPAPLPPGVFSSTIVQLTPFGVKLTLGGKLTFPNADALPAGAAAKLYRFDQTPGSPTLGEFVEAGAALVSADGQRVETAANAIAETSIHFVAIPRPVTNVFGKVVDGDSATPVRQAAVRVRGQESFTDATGVFVIRDVAVKDANDALTIDASFQRPDGRVDRATRSGVLPRLNGVTSVTPPLVLSSPATTPNQKPVILAPPNLSVTEGVTLNTDFVASDPDAGQTIQVIVSGAPFASVNLKSGNVYTLRLAPGANAAGNYTLAVKATDDQNASTTQNVALTVFANRPPVLTVPGPQTVVASQNLSFTVSAIDPDDGQTLTYSATGLPSGASFNPTTRQFSWTPVAGQTGSFTVSFRASDNGLTPLSDTKTVVITVATAVFVTNTSDSGAGSLRAALATANANAGMGILFNIPTSDPNFGGGVFTIKPVSPLPAITANGTIIDGASQTAFTGNTNPAGPEVVLNGLLAGTTDTADGLSISAANCLIQGLVINGFSHNQVAITGTQAKSNIVRGCYLNTNAAGTSSGANPMPGVPGGNGVFISGGAQSNLIGGRAPDARNVISGNSANGVAIFDATSTNNLVQGNFIGTNAAGMGVLANGSASAGVLVWGAANIIGGTTAGTGNVISGNGSGISIAGADATGNQVLGNIIGLNAAATAKIPNTSIGVGITGASNNTIGGSAVGARNIISGNAASAVLIQASGAAAENNIVAGNIIGTNASDAAELGNGGGILLNAASGFSGANNVIGGTAAGAGNIISGNRADGVQLNGVGAMNNLIQGNRIGTNAAGTAALKNADYGVYLINAPNNTIGGTAPNAGNLISGHDAGGLAGVRIESASATSNRVQGNFIGTNAAGTSPIGNANGVVIFGASGNTIGGTDPRAGNIISGNTSSGVFLSDATSTNNLVQGNYIGTNVSGAALMANDTGVLISNASNNTIGGTASGARNVIASSSTGVAIFGSGTTANNNVIAGNYIGTAVNGLTTLGAGGFGVYIQDAPGNIIGGTTAAARNVIGGWTNGVYTVSPTMPSFVSGTVIAGNYIGLGADGTTAIGNSNLGVYLDRSSGVTVGGTSAGARNVIAASGADGIFITGAGSASNNLVQGNYIGTDATGALDRGNTRFGVSIFSPNNTVGGTATGAGNLISGNHSVGVYLNSDGNTIQGNKIGTEVTGSRALANSGQGIAIVSCSNNQIGGTAAGAGNIIAFNGGVGVQVIGTIPLINNRIQGNSIFNNAGLGIDLGNDGVTGNDPGDGDTGPNNLQNFPILTSVVIAGGTATINGTLNSTPDTSFRLEFFANNACDPTGFGQGQTFIGSLTVTTNGSSSAAFTTSLPVSVSQGQFITATATDPNGNTSEFSKCVSPAGTTGGAMPTAPIRH